MDPITTACNSGGTVKNIKINNIGPGDPGAVSMGENKMAKYYHIKKTSVPAFIRRLNAIESKTGIFYNIAVLPYRGKKYSPDLYATVKIG